MSDRRMRELERLYAAGDVSILPALNAARQRNGLPTIRTKVVHYVKANGHHRLNREGVFDPRVDRSRVYSACGMAEVWPRQYYSPSKRIHYTPNKDEVTCKVCLKCINSPKFYEGEPALHWLQERINGPRNLCGAQWGRSTDDPDLVRCGGCVRLITGQNCARNGHKLNARGRRRLRRQQMFAR